MTTRDDDTIAWYENTVGDGSAWAEHTVSTSATDACSVHAADVDGDGDIDLMSASIDDDTIAWYENTAGGGSAWATDDVTTSADDACSVRAADVDADGDQIDTTMKYLPYGETRSGSVPTDKLFTGQRLDDTGLYFYNARYYDPAIGRFISADIIITNIMNPQTFNRYSYCLNNPLRYIDPTGFWGEILEDPYDEGALGFTSDEGWLIGIGGEWVSITGTAVDTMLSEFRESTSATWTEFAQDFGLPFASKEVPSDLWGYNTSKAGENRYFWDVEQRYNREKDITGQYPMEPRLTLIEQHEMTTQDWIVTCDALAVAGDAISFFPPAFPVGYGLSAVASTVGYRLTLSEYRKGNITENDMLRAHINWSAGFIPIWGFIPAGLQTWFDWPW